MCAVPLPWHDSHIAFGTTCPLVAFPRACGFVPNAFAWSWQSPHDIVGVASAAAAGVAGAFGCSGCAGVGVAGGAGGCCTTGCGSGCGCLAITPGDRPITS